jgi:GMP synthase-like glutamine amidotransferase
LQTARPEWETEAFWVCRGEFPETLEGFDGVLIGGSPASVTEAAPWMLRLEALIREILGDMPIFGACFGHQIIATALGGRIIRNPQGWGHGLLHLRRARQMPWSVSSEGVKLYGSHIEQVAEPPEGTQVVFEGEGLPVGGFAMGDHLFTVQHHPEMSHQFIEDLVHEYAGVTGPEVTAQALDSLDQPADSALIAEEIARFFEHARAKGTGTRTGKRRAG